MAEEQKKGTIYQQLNKMLNLDGFGFQDQQATISQSTPVKEPPKIIIKGNTPEEIQRKGLELQQKKELQNKFFRTTDRGFQKALQYEAARLPAYIDYEGMEYYPIISSALDLFMEEATTIGLNGNMLNVYSNKERIKMLLEEFFYDTVNVNVNLPFWVRNVCKYGDNFVLLYGERKKGITHVKQLVNYEIERFERISDGKPLVKFRERMTGDEFNVFELAHFRLLGDDKYLPYGSCLLSDSYIKTSNGIKEIKNILKGDIVVGFDIKTQKKIESNVLDVVCNGEKQTYKISTQHNFVKATDNHKIPFYDYNDNLFKEKFVNELKIGDGLIINNHDDYNEQIKINKAVEIKEHKNRIYDDFVGDLKYIPDYIDKDFAKLFGFLLGDGGVNGKRPYMVYFAYGVHDIINQKYIKLLEKFSNKEIYLRKNNKYANGIASAVVNSKSLATILKNMEFVGDSRTKRIPKWIFSASVDIRKAFLEGIFDADGSVNIDKWNCKRFSIEMSNYNLVNDIKLLAQSLGYKTGGINKRKKRENVIISNNKVINIADSYTLYYYESENEQTIISDIKNRLTNDFIVEKIKSIELDEIGFVYDIQVDNENHNFFANNVLVHNSVLNKVRRVFRQLVMAEDAMLTYRIIRAGEKKVFKIDVGNIDEEDIEDYIYKVATKFKKIAQVQPNDGQIDYRFNILGNDEDYFLPVRNANTQTGIETLPGASNLDQIQDIEYLRDNLFMGLGIPKPFLSFQDAAGAGKTMAQYDIRFSKKINRIQQAMIQELNKMAMIHLYLLGYTGEDLSGFQLTLTNPSTQQEQLKAELLREKAQTYTELTRAEGGIAAMSHTNAKRMMFNWSDKEIVDDLKQQKMEKVVMQELQDSPVTIKKSGLFTDIDNRFGTPEEALIGAETGTTAPGAPPMGGAGAPPAGAPPMGGAGAPPMGGAGMPPAGAPPAGGAEGGMPPLAEGRRKLSEEEYNRQVEKLVFGSSQEPEHKNGRRHKQIIKENNAINDSLNKKANEMVNEIDALLNNTKSINTQQNINEAEDIDLTTIEGIENIE
jgi:intein/homing endonuclease